MSTFDRRRFLKLSGTSLIGLTMGGAALRVQAQEKLDLDNPSAKALKYVHKSEVEGQICDNCMHIKGADGEAWRPCALFPGKLVAAEGWCAGWMKKA